MPNIKFTVAKCRDGMLVYRNGNWLMSNSSGVKPNSSTYQLVLGVRKSFTTPNNHTSWSKTDAVASG
jgi:hypothetical protein